MTTGWPEPPEPPEVPQATAAALADYCEAMAKQLMHEWSLSVAAGPDAMETTLVAVQGNLMPARVLRETYDVDLDKYR